ncbi:MAG: hypothetical protein JW731_05875 [Bacteroidales bacterium]|nr:hypothetical protein [Bacteroidales bacterium]
MSEIRNLNELRNIHDVRLLKERLKYEIKLNEQDLFNDFQYLKISIVDSVKTAVRDLGQEIITSAILKFIDRYRRNRR